VGGLRRRSQSRSPPLVSAQAVLEDDVHDHSRPHMPVRRLTRREPFSTNPYWSRLASCRPTILVVYLPLEMSSKEMADLLARRLLQSILFLPPNLRRQPEFSREQPGQGRSPARATHACSTHHTGRYQPQFSSCAMLANQAPLALNRWPPAMLLK